MRRKPPVRLPGYLDRANQLVEMLVEFDHPTFETSADEPCVWQRRLDARQSEELSQVFERQPRAHPSRRAGVPQALQRPASPDVLLRAHAEGIELLLRADSAGAVHGLIDWCREGNIRYSVGYELTDQGPRGDPRSPREHLGSRDHAAGLDARQR